MPDLVRHLDVPYATIEGVDPKLLSLDLYAPQNAGRQPVMVMIHGGGWRNGDKANAGMTRTKVPFFVGRGYVYVSINYRLSSAPDVKHPLHVQDVAAALAWVHDHVAEYGGRSRSPLRHGALRRARTSPRWSRPTIVGWRRTASRSRS